MSKSTRKYNKQHMERAINNLNMPFRHILSILGSFVPYSGTTQEENLQENDSDIEAETLDVTRIMQDLERIPEQYHYITKPLETALEGLTVVSDILEEVQKVL